MHDHHDGCSCGHSHDRSDAGAGDSTGATLFAVSVGNTRTQFGVFRDSTPSKIQSLPNEPFDALAQTLTREFVSASGEESAALIASVNDPVADRIERALRAAPDADPEAVLRLGRDVPIPLRHTLDAAGEKSVGQDRLLDALGAFEVVRQACVVIDAGTCITVDFVDGDGVFHGGAIAPGAGLMLRTLHERTAALPEQALRLPESLASAGAPPFGKNTPEAMLNGVVFAARGLARALAERFAEFYEAYPQIVATGGDAPLLFEGDELVETIVPDLTLRGIAAAWRAFLESPVGAEPEE